jgi:alpha-galactosidase
MPKITFVGAGSVVFTRDLCNDILLTPALQASTIALMDIDPQRLALAKRTVQAIVDRRGLRTKVTATTDQQEAVKGTDYVITIFQQGGLTAHSLDIEIPLKYGVDQVIGDTLGPGGIFRGLRTYPVMQELCRNMDDLAPDALLLNYVNPMTANCWAIDRGTGRPVVGLCHSVQGTSQMLASWIEVPYDEITYLCAGINHQAFFLEFRHGEEDLYPRIREAIERPEIAGAEPVRIDLFKHFGYFVTESSGHASEYVPYFRKSPEMVETDLVPRFTTPGNEWFDNGRTGGYLRKQQGTGQRPGRSASRALLRVLRAHHRSRGEGHPNPHQWQRHQPQSDRKPAAGLLRGSPLPGGRQWCPAGTRRSLPDPTGSAKPHQHQRAGVNR